MRVESHAGTQLGLLHRLDGHGVSPPRQVPRDGRIVHAKEGVAGVEEDGARAGMGGTLHAPIIMMR